MKYTAACATVANSSKKAVAKTAFLLCIHFHRWPGHDLNITKQVFLSDQLQSNMAEVIQQP